MYKPIYDRASGSKRIAEIFTWVLLCILIPSTALGYFAEGSIPGQPLYPIKLGIEKTALSLQFLSPQAQASYQVGLVNKRFDEVETLLTKNTTNGEDLSNFGPQLAAATTYIVSLPDSPQKTELKQKLLVNIQTYQQQLKDQQQIIENKQQVQQIEQIQNYQNPRVSNQTLHYTPPPAENTKNYTTQPTATPAPSNSASDSQSIIQAINDMQSQMDNATNNLQNNTSQNTQQPTSTPTQEPTETPTDVPTPTDAVPTVQYGPEACGQHNGYCVSRYTQCPSGNIVAQFNYPNSCPLQNPVCCYKTPTTPTPTPYPYNNDHKNN